MNVLYLQIIAMVTMFCDHFAEFMDNWVVLRCIGRFAFPIYAFLLAEGFRHMRDNKSRIEQHLGGLLVLAIISECAYDLLEVNAFTLSEFINSQSVLVTLLLAFLGLMAIDRWKQDHPLWMWSVIVLTSAANYLLMSNYKLVGVLLVYAFYYYQNHILQKGFGIRLITLLVMIAVYLPFYHWARYNFCDATVFLENLQGDNTWWYITHIGVAALLATYTGKLGPYSKGFKKIYRCFYPAHLFILGCIKQFII